MKALNSLLALMFLAGAVAVGAVPAQAQDVLAKIRLGNSDYCHMKFPAIQEGTLSSEPHVLKDAGSGDIIDFYGPCSYDPRGEQAAWTQWIQAFRKHPYE